MLLFKTSSIFLLTGAAVFAGNDTPAGWTRQVTIQAEAKSVKRNGRPWDANDISIMPPLPHIFGAVFFPATAPAPDMLICVADEVGAKRCYHHTKRNPMGVPYSLCQDSYSCTLQAVPVPENYFGVLVADLDFFNQNDFVMAQVVYDGPKDARRIYQVEKHLHELARQWNVTDAPEQFTAAPLDTCTLDKPCVPTGGAGWLGFADAKAEECGPEITFTLAASNPSLSLPTLELEVADLHNECPGQLEFMWNFGDGKIAITSSGNTSHAYSDPGSFEVTATPRCRRQFTLCEAPKVSRRFEVR